MAAEISRIAHFYGEGLPVPTEVLRAKLGKQGVVYFLSQYDREVPQQVPAIAMTTYDETPTSFLAHARFEGDQGSRIYKTMLAHAALYSEALEGRGDGLSSQEYKHALQDYEKTANTNETLRRAQVYRTRYLPE